MTYDTEAENIEWITSRNRGVIESVGILSQIFLEPVLISLKRCPSLEDKLVHRHL